MAISRGNIEGLTTGEVAVFGVPWDENSSFLRGPAKAPPLIIRALESESANYYTEKRTDLNEHSRIRWLGNIPCDDYMGISDPISRILDRNAIPVTLGGDHSITYPIIRSVAQKYPDLTIVQFDAHGDLYDELDGNKYSHACPFARIMEEELAHRLIQLGIRTMTLHQQDQVTRFGVEVHEMRDLDEPPQLRLKGPVYITFDLDVLDPAFAPGISHHEPGGMTTRQAISIIQNLNADIIGADVVEYNPDRDVNGVTAMVASKILKEILDIVL